VRARRDLVVGLAALALSLALAAPAAAAVELISATPTGAAPDAPSTLGDVSQDGRFVVFASQAANLTSGQVDAPHRPGDPFGAGSWDVFLRDRVTRKTTLVSHAAGLPTTGGRIGNGNDDSQFPRLSGDGRWVVYVSRRSNLVPGQSGSAAPDRR
jgi:Tol biopolymer transport system component